MRRARCVHTSPSCHAMYSGQTYTRSIMTQTRRRSSNSLLLLLQVTCSSANCPGPCRVCNLATDSCELSSHTGTCPTAEQKTGRCVGGTCKVNAAHLVAH